MGRFVHRQSGAVGVGVSAPNVRLIDPLKSEAAGFARGLGISLSALVAVAVRDYLDARREVAQAVPGTAKAAATSTPGVSPGATERLPVPRAAVAKAGRNDPCPCGSGRKYKACHGAAR